MKKLRILLIFSKLVVTKPLITIIALMHNFIVKFGKILDIFKKFAGNRVNELGNVPRCGVVPKFSDLCIDSKPVKVCLNARAKRCAMGRDNAKPLLLRIAGFALLWL